MKRISRYLSLLVCFSFVNLVFAQDEQKLELKTEKVAGSVYMLSGVGAFTGGNIGLSIGDDGVAMIDNGVPALLEVLKAEVAKSTDKSIDYLINTHAHGDHTGNNVYYGGDGSRIVSHRNLRRSLVNSDTQEKGLPVITFSDQMTLHINDDAARIIHYANAHTDGDAIVVFENANVIHTGDIMFNGLFPFIDAKSGGTVPGAINALTAIAELCNDETKVIPGHGSLASKADVLSNVNMLETGFNNVKALVADGQSNEEIHAAKPLADFESFSWGFIDSERMVNQLINDARK